MYYFMHLCVYMRACVCVCTCKYMCVYASSIGWMHYELTCPDMWDCDVAWLLGIWSWYECTEISQYHRSNSPCKTPYISNTTHTHTHYYSVSLSITVQLTRRCAWVLVKMESNISWAAVLVSEKKSAMNKYSLQALSISAKWMLLNNASYGYCKWEGKKSFT